MKKNSLLVILIFALLIFPLACAAPPANKEAPSANTAPTTTSTAISEADVIAKEKAVWDAIKNKDYDTFGDMLADNQVEVLEDGLRDKTGSIAGVKDFEPQEVTFSDWKYLPINKDLVLLVYSVNFKGKFKGEEFPATSARASSAWANRNGEWLAVYHQESPVSSKPAPPPPAKSAEKTTATPASAVSPTTMPADPIASEKAIWERLKARDFEGFASFLAPESIEVEPTGVYDKAGSVKAVEQFDFKDVQLSDFRSVPFDAETELVTYQVKLPGRAPAELHSTIWTRRDGKWLAIFHHGTPQTQTAATASPSPKTPAMKASPEK